MKQLKELKYKINKYYTKLQLLIIKFILKRFGLKISLTENGTFYNLSIYHKESKNGFWILIDCIDNFTWLNKSYVEDQ